jgi:hypothetical protein
MVSRIIILESDVEETHNTTPLPCRHARIVRTWDCDGVDAIFQCLDCRAWEYVYSCGPLSRVFNSIFTDTQDP